MQSGHGKVYIDSFGLFISIPLASLCALILSKCRFNAFHLHINENYGFNKQDGQVLRTQDKPKQHYGQIVLSYPIRGLSKSTASLLLSGLIVFECPPYKYLL